MNCAWPFVFFLRLLLLHNMSCIHEPHSLMEDIPNACFWAFCSCWYYSSSMHFYFACLLSDSRNWHLLLGLGLSNIRALFSLSTNSLWVTDHSRIVYFFFTNCLQYPEGFILFMNTTYDIVKKQDTVAEIRWMRWKANLYLLCIADMAFEFYCSLALIQLLKDVCSLVNWLYAWIDIELCVAIVICNTLSLTSLAWKLNCLSFFFFC